jgi:hypothetical protein
MRDFLILLAWVWIITSKSLAQQGPGEQLNRNVWSAFTSTNADGELLLRVPVLLDGHRVEVSVSALASSDERQAHAAAWASKHGIVGGDAVARLNEALDNAYNSAAVQYQQAEAKPSLAAAYDDVLHLLKGVDSDMIDLRVGPSTVS